MKKKISFPEISAAANAAGDELSNLLDEIVQSHPIDDPPFLSDALSKIHSGGYYLIKKMGDLWENRKERHHRWKIRILCDEWGTPAKPGDIVRRWTSKDRRDKAGQLVRNIERNASIAAGTEKDDFFNCSEFVVDEKGCIECEFDDAMYFLNVYGIHSRSRRALNPQYTKSKSREPVVDRNDGQSKFIHYHRHMEVDAAQYAALPNLTAKDADKTDETKPRQRRQRKTNDAVTEAAETPQDASGIDADEPAQE
jgi:hypothetical protein